MTNAAEVCLCGSGQTYEHHCGRLHRDGAGMGTTAESLMRARYSAYVRHDAEFLLRSWHEETRPPSIQFDHDLEWLGLTIVATDQGGAFDNTGVVEFRARFRRGVEHLELHEVSSFVRVDGRWVYIAGS